jgi:hypothetical protein
MQIKKPASLMSPAGLLRLVVHATMGIAMGLWFALLLILIDPSGIATLIDHAGDRAITVLVGTLALTFGIGATLTGAVFMMTEDR